MHLDAYGFDSRYSHTTYTPTERATMLHEDKVYIVWTIEDEVSEMLVSTQNCLYAEEQADEYQDCTDAPVYITTVVLGVGVDIEEDTGTGNVHRYVYGRPKFERFTYSERG